MPRSLGRHRSVANINLRGKKERLLHCRCCSAFNFRDRELEKEHKKEMRNYLRGFSSEEERLLAKQ